MATVLKQQASAAGITINLQSITSTAFFGPNYLKWTFAQDWWSGYPYLRQVGYSMMPGAPWDETHWNTSQYGAKYLSLYKTALQHRRPDQAGRHRHEMQMMDYNYGGYIIPVFNPVIVGQANNLQGAVNQKSGDPWIQYQSPDDVVQLIADLTTAAGAAVVVTCHCGFEPARGTVAGAFHQLGETTITGS